MTEHTLESLLARCKLTPTGCLEWQGGRYAKEPPKNYPKVHVGAHRYEGGHRLAAALATGVVLTSDVHVRHNCDNPPCMNPEHLIAGTQAENMADMKRKHRGRTSPGRKGEGNPVARFTEAQVLAMRRMRAGGATYRAICDAFGMSNAGQAWTAVNRNWSHIPTPALPIFDRATMSTWGAKLTPTDVREIRQLEGHLSRAAIARQFGVGETTVRQVLSGKTWAHVT